jgi:Superinfection immunity protein
VIDWRYAMLARGGVETVAAAAISVFLYFVPTVIAVGRRAPNAVSVFGVNLLLGWTGVGWLIALFMSAGRDERSRPGPSFTHIGTRYRLGYSFEPPSYCIWDNDHPGPPVERFPYTEHGKDEALDRFRTLEPEASDVERKPETA